MASVLLIGNSHLECCYNRAKSDELLNFGFSNLKINWQKGLEQLKNVQKLYKETTVKCGQPDAVFVMCGGYELMLTKDLKGVANKLKAFVHTIRSNKIKFVVVCSILDRKCSTQNEEVTVNREIRSTNKMLAKAFKDLDNVFFINIRPPGNVKNIMADDKYHLKGELYDHVNKRLISCFTERIYPHLHNITISAKSTLDQAKEVSEKDEPSGSPRKGAEPKLDKRLDQFKKTLVDDYKQYCIREKELTTQFQAIQEKLEKVSSEKVEMENIFKRLFGVDLTEGKVN